MPSVPHHVRPRLESARLALVYKSPVPAPLRPAGLGVTASCNARTLQRAGIWADAWPATGADALRTRLECAIADAYDRRVQPPTHVVVHAPWLTTEEVAVLARDFPEVTFAIVSHSNWGFLNADPHAVRLLRELVDLQHTAHNVRVGGNCAKFVESARTLWATDIALLPNLYDLHQPMPAARRTWAGDSLRVGLFGAGRPLKNGLTAAAATALLAATLRVPTELYVSTDVDAGGIASAVRELLDGSPTVRIVDAGWLPWARFRKLVGHMHVLLQPSFTESFNVVTADGIWAGVPTVTSHAIDWVPERWKADADDAGDVARVAEHLLRAPHHVEDGRRALAEYIGRALGAWRQFIAGDASVQSLASEAAC